MVTLNKTIIKINTPIRPGLIASRATARKIARARACGLQLVEIKKELGLKTIPWLDQQAIITIEESELLTETQPQAETSPRLQKRVTNLLDGRRQIIKLKHHGPNSLGNFVLSEQPDSVAIRTYKVHSGSFNLVINGQSLKISSLPMDLTVIHIAIVQKRDIQNKPAKIVYGWTRKEELGLLGKEEIGYSIATKTKAGWQTNKRAVPQGSGSRTAEIMAETREMISYLLKYTYPKSFPRDWDVKTAGRNHYISYMYQQKTYSINGLKGFERIRSEIYTQASLPRQAVLELLNGDSLALEDIFINPNETELLFWFDAKQRINACVDNERLKQDLLSLLEKSQKINKQTRLEKIAYLYAYDKSLKLQPDIIGIFRMGIKEPQKPPQLLRPPQPIMAITSEQANKNRGIALTDFLLNDQAEGAVFEIEDWQVNQDGFAHLVTIKGAPHRIYVSNNLSQPLAFGLVRQEENRKIVYAWPNKQDYLEGKSPLKEKGRLVAIKREDQWLTIRCTNPTRKAAQAASELYIEKLFQDQGEEELYSVWNITTKGKGGQARIYKRIKGRIVAFACQAKDTQDLKKVYAVTIQTDGIIKIIKFYHSEASYKAGEASLASGVIAVKESNSWKIYRFPLSLKHRVSFPKAPLLPSTLSFLINSPSLNQQFPDFMARARSQANFTH